MRVYGPKHGIPQESGYQADGSYRPNEYYMQMAINYAEECVARGQHPVGAVVTRTIGVSDPRTHEMIDYEFVAGVGVNEVDNDSTRHAERVSLEKAEMYHGRRQLHYLKSVLYTTHEPCPMCAGAIANSKLHGIVFGTSADDAQQLVRTEGIKWRSNRVSGLDIIRGRIESGAPEQFIIGGFMREQCLELLKTAGRLPMMATSPPARRFANMDEAVNEMQAFYERELASGADGNQAQNAALEFLFGIAGDQTA